MDDEARKSKVEKTGQLFLAVGFLFLAAAWIVDFEGSHWAWTAIVLGSIGLAISLVKLLRDFWKPHA